MGRISTTLVASFFCLGLTGALEAQGEFSYGFQDAPASIQAEAGTTVPFQIKLVLGSSGLDGANGPQGWSLGIANSGVDITAVTTSGTAAADAADGGLRNTGFEVFEIVNPDRNDGQQGLVQALVLSFVMPITLPPNTEQVIGLVDYEATVGAAPSQGTIRYQNGLVGSGQPVNNDVTFEGQTAEPSLAELVIAIEPPPPPETDCDDGEDNDGDGDADCDDSDCADAASCAGGTDLKIGTPDDANASQIALCTTEGGEAIVTAYVGPNDPADPPSDGAQGWSLGIEHNPAELTITNDTFPTTSGTVAGDVNDGGLRNTGFEKTEIIDPARNEGRAGLVSAVVLSFTMPIVLNPNEDQSILRARYVVAEGAGGEGFSSEINFVDGLIGSGQPVDTVLTVRGQTLDPTEVQGITIVHSDDACAPPGVVFTRADANNDDKVDIADPIFTINWLIRNGPTPACIASADANDDGKTDLSDPLYTIAYRFQAGPVPPAPFPSCGQDATPDGLSCNDSSCP